MQLMYFLIDKFLLSLILKEQSPCLLTLRRYLIILTMAIINDPSATDPREYLIKF